MDLLAPAPGATIVDGTLGAAGHTRALLATLGEGRLVGIDRDPRAIARGFEIGDPRLTLVEGNFGDLGTILDRLGIGAIDGVLLDLGFSSDQLDAPERGFSFRAEGPLDMRLDQDGGDPTAADLVNQLTERDLAGIIWRYGEERWARRIAQRIVERRPLRTTTELADLIAGAIPRGAWPKGIHPATRTFQALRIEVNDELASLERGLGAAIERLRAGGRIVVISFHSLEDGIVKRRFRDETRDCICPPEQPQCTCEHRRRLRILTRKPVQPAPDEIMANPRSRSARLRAAERL
ncbi:MAG: 16S rRNA (cytosine(1402)-N(4))-methyltransferase RsmH [Candidatus Dormiibacterota bacterium]